MHPYGRASAQQDHIIELVIHVPKQCHDIVYGVISSMTCKAWLHLRPHPSTRITLQASADKTSRAGLLAPCTIHTADMSTGLLGSALVMLYC